MRGPLAVTIRDGDRTVDVTDQTRGLSLSWSAYGGDKGMQGVVRVGAGTFPNLGAGDTVSVFDGRNGDVVWVGDAISPGVTRGPAGESYDVVAVGGANRLQSFARVLAPVLVDQSQLYRSSNSTKGANTSADERGEGNPTLEVTASEGKTVTVSWQGEWILRTLRAANLEVARVRADVDAGVTNANFVMQLLTGTTVADLAVRDSITSRTTGAVLAASVGGTTNIPANQTLAALRVVRNTSSISGQDEHWFRFSDVVVRQTLRDAFGNDRRGVYGQNTVTASEVIADMVGRGMCPGLDPQKVTIADTDYPIDSLAWLDGTTMGDALTELLVFERDLFWMVSGDSGKFGLFDHTRPRYVISQTDGGVEFPGQEDTRANRVLVSWTDKRGDEQTTIVTADVDDLPYTRDYQSGIQLPAGFGSPANAQRAGERVLAAINAQPRAGTATVRRRVMDQWDGCMVSPHEIRPGCMVTDSETGQNLRLTEVSYDDDSATASLSLEEPARSEESIVRRLKRVERKVKRRKK